MIFRNDLVKTAKFAQLTIFHEDLPKFTFPHHFSLMAFQNFIIFIIFAIFVGFVIIFRCFI